MSSILAVTDTHRTPAVMSKCVPVISSELTFLHAIVGLGSPSAIHGMVTDCIGWRW